MATRTIGTEIVLTGEKAFNDAMKGVNNNLKNLRADMVLTTAEFDGNTDSIEALTAKQKILEQSVDQHRAKVDALTRMYEKQVEANGENSAAADKYRLQLTQATVALVKEENALKGTVSAIKNKVDAENDAKAAAAAAEKAAREQAKAQAEAAAAAEKLAKKQEFLAKTNPVKQIKKASDGYRHLVERLAEAQEKTEQFAEKQKKAGELLKQVSKPITVLPTVTGKAVSGVTKGVGAITAASAAGVAALGAAGIAAVSLMASAAKESAEAAKAAQEAGETLTETQQKWLAYSDQLGALDGAVANAKSAIAGVLLPVLGDLSAEGAAFLSDFAADMEATAGNTERQGQVMAEYIHRGAKLIKEKLPEYIEVGKELISGLLTGLSADADDLMDMGIDLVMYLLDGIIEYAPDLAQAAIVLVEKLVQSLTDRGPDLLTSAVGMVSEIVTGLAKAAPTLVPAAMQLVMQLVLALVSNAPLLLEAGLELIYGILSGIFNGLGDISGSAGEIVDVFKESFEACFDIFKNIGGKIIALIKQGISDAWGNLVSWFNSLWDNLFSDRDVNVNVNGNSDNGELPDGSAAAGLAYVPYDGYLARLHRGETVLTATEAAAYRRSKVGGQTTKQFNLTINTQSLSKEELDMIVAYVNGKLGDDL